MIKEQIRDFSRGDAESAERDTEIISCRIFSASSAPPRATSPALAALKKSLLHQAFSGAL